MTLEHRISPAVALRPGVAVRSRGSHGAVGSPYDERVLILIDLDNTLIDRDAAFRGAVAAFLAGHGLPGADLAWVMEIDASGYATRDTVARAITERYRDEVPPSAVRALLDRGAADRVELPRETEEALLAVREAGGECVIVTNGRVAQQEAKIRNTGLDRLVQGWVVSEAMGCKKPAPEIFRAAAGLTGRPVDGAWVIGDSPHADIAGAAALGLRSVWVSHGRTWSDPAFRPTRVAADVVTAIRDVAGGHGRVS
ncbi:HAD family hydrolase [Actinoplanes sp. NPDC024001]|uniref:HAD family hydrolase n=1 Tax=Actinoplanes sp. NPDC024001 TaxID=3154598 RepID=UPI0033D78ECB